MLLLCVIVFLKLIFLSSLLQLTQSQWLWYLKARLFVWSIDNDNTVLFPIFMQVKIHCSTPKSKLRFNCSLACKSRLCWIFYSYTIANLFICFRVRQSWKETNLHSKHQDSIDFLDSKPDGSDHRFNSSVRDPSNQLSNTYTEEPEDMVSFSCT